MKNDYDKFRKQDTKLNQAQSQLHKNTFMPGEKTERRYAKTVVMIKFGVEQLSCIFHNQRM